MRNSHFSRKWFFTDNFLGMKDTGKASLCLAYRAGSKHLLFDFESLISKFDLRSGQVKVRPMSGHCQSR